MDLLLFDVFVVIWFILQEVADLISLSGLITSSLDLLLVSCNLSSRQKSSLPSLHANEQKWYLNLSLLKIMQVWNLKPYFNRASAAAELVVSDTYTVCSCYFCVQECKIKSQAPVK